MAKFGEAIELSLDDLEGWGSGYTLQVKQARAELEAMRATDLLFRVLASGNARIDGNEFCFDGLRYYMLPWLDTSAETLVRVIGQEQLDAACHPREGG